MSRKEGESIEYILADACSDPTATFDSLGNAYVGGIIFDVASNANAIVVAKSNAGIGGAFYHTPADIPFQEYNTSPLGVVANDDDPNIFNDKEFIVADSSSGSPKANNVYATWTRFEFGTGVGVGGHSPIYFSQSTDGGATWSEAYNIAPEKHSGPSAQWQPWSAVSKDGKTLWVAYYDRSYADCEFTGCNDITLAKISIPASKKPSVSYTRLTSASMPNLIVANNPVQARSSRLVAKTKLHPLVPHEWSNWADNSGRLETVSLCNSSNRKGQKLPANWLRRSASPESILVYCSKRILPLPLLRCRWVMIDSKLRLVYCSRQVKSNSLTACIAETCRCCKSRSKHCSHLTPQSSPTQ